MRRTLIAAALAALVWVAVAPAAGAHRLGKKRAADATVETEAKDCADHPELYPGCTDTTATDCRRLTKHKVKCTGHIIGVRPSDSAPYDCERVYTWKIKPRRRARLLFGKRGPQTCVIGEGAQRQARDLALRTCGATRLYVRRGDHRRDGRGAGRPSTMRVSSPSIDSIVRERRSLA